MSVPLLLQGLLVPGIAVHQPSTMPAARCHSGWLWLVLGELCGAGSVSHLSEGAAASDSAPDLVTTVKTLSVIRHAIHSVQENPSSSGRLITP